MLPEGATSATVCFDLMLLDSCDATIPVHSDINLGGRGDGVAFTVNGTEVGFSAMASTVSTAPSGTMGIGGSSDQSVGDESLGIDNHRLSAVVP